MRRKLPVSSQRPTVVYTRVSTAGQRDEGVSLAAQLQRARAWAAANDYEVAGEFTDRGISGKRADNRPGLQAALSLVRKTRGALVVYSLSRLARSTKDAIDIAECLQKCGADLISLTEQIDTRSAVGKMFFRLLATLAEFERDLISERTSAALAHKRSRSERIGEVPFGSRLVDDVRLEVDAEEQRTLELIQALRRGGVSWSSVATRLNESAVKTKKGSAWTAQNVRKIYIGWKERSSNG